jgi:hypothetical protein
MDERDKLTAVLEKLDNDSARMLARFAEIMIEEQKADPMHDTTDVRVRFEQFKQWCLANNLDLAAVEAWAQDARRAKEQAAAPATRSR